MRYTLRVPTEQYAFWECEYEGTAEDAYRHYCEMIGISRGGVGLSEKEWAHALDDYLSGKGITPELFYKCNREQQLLISELRKSRRRRGLDANQKHS